MRDLVRVRFALEREDDGWPPVESEGLWAEPRRRGYRLDSTPFFLFGISADDVVRAAPDADGVLWCTEVVQRSGRLVIRVIPRADGPLRGDREAVREAFAPLGVSGEAMATPLSMVALDVGPDVDLAAVKALTLEGERLGHWDYEEACISSAWRSL